MKLHINIIEWIIQDKYNLQAAMLQVCIFWWRWKAAIVASKNLSKCGWHVFERFSNLPLKSDCKSGFKSQFYERTKDGKDYFCYAFAGTDYAQDILDDICQYFGIIPKQYQTAIVNTVVIATTLKGLFGENVDLLL